MSVGSESKVAEISRSELLLALRTDCVTFFAFYCADDLTLEVPDLHLEVWEELLVAIEAINKRETNRLIHKLFAIPRGFAKSTIAKLAMILFIKYSYMRFFLYVSKTNAHAKNAIRDIMTWLLSDNERNLFGKALVIKQSETESLWIMDVPIWVSPDSKPYMKRVIFKALGADQQVRGLNIFNLRPQMIVVDDIEDLDNTTPELQPKLDTWFMGSLYKAFATEAFVMFIGNMIRETSLLARLSKDPEWNPTVYGALIHRGGQIVSLWEEKFPAKILIAEYAKYRKLGLGHVWEAEMMNLTQDQILAKDLHNVIRPSMPSPEDLSAGALVLDPAYGEESQHDYSAITVHARIRDIAIPAVIDSVCRKMTHEDVLDEMLRLSYYWGITTWIIESEAGQRLFIPLFKLLLKERKIPDGFFLMLPIGSGGKKKPSRILGFRNIVTSGSYAICDSQQELVDKLAAYTSETKHEDLEDSASYGAVLWQYFDAVIESQGIQQVAINLHRFQTGQVETEQIESAVTSF